MDCQNPADMYLQLMNYYAKENTIPVNATFELTPLCNFNCPMCYVHLSKDEQQRAGKMLSKEQWLDIARQAKELGVIKLTVTGGEALTRPDFWEIWAELNKMGFLISLLSNGYLIDESVIEKFREYGAPYVIKLSIYGASNETYEEFCGVKNGFDRFSRAVDLIKEAGIPLKVTSTVVKENQKDFQLLYKFAAEKKINFQHTIAVAKSGRGTSTHPDSSRFFLSDFDNELTVESLEKMKRPKLPTPYTICGQYRKAFWMGWDGTMLGCSFARNPGVSVLDKTLEEAWHQLVALQDAVKEPPECEDCKYFEFCRKCPGVLSAESGSPEKVSKGYCEDAKNLYEKYIALKNQQSPN